MIRITSTVTIDETELHFDFVRSSGPGGQNVNKVSTAVQLRFDATHSPSLSEELRKRLARLAGKRITVDGVLVITARRYRTQQKNRDDAVSRLVDLLRRAAIVPKTRRKTKPTKQSKERRLEDKRRKSRVKQTRKRVAHQDE
jgi:ribosome-associated protein